MCLIIRDPSTKQDDGCVSRNTNLGYEFEISDCNLRMSPVCVKEKQDYLKPLDKSDGKSFGCHI